MAQTIDLGKVTGPKGDKGDVGPIGPKGDKGDKGDPLKFSDLTTEQKQELKQDITTVNHEYKSTYNAQSSITTVPIGIAEYKAGVGLLEVYISGLRLIENVDYTLSGTNITLKKVLDAGAQVHFVYTKSIAATESDLNAFKGPKGDKGDAGPVGPQGGPGPQGSQGINILPKTNQGIKNWIKAHTTKDEKIQIEEVMVDGVNAIKIKVLNTLSNWAYVFFKIEESAASRIMPNQMYTLSAKVYSKVEKLISFSISRGDGTNIILSAKGVTTSPNKWVDVNNCNLTQSQFEISQQGVYINLLGLTTGDILIIKDLKLEIDKVKNPIWTPAPQDLIGPVGPTGAKGDKGDPFKYTDFTKEQLADLRKEVSSFYKKFESVYKTTKANETIIPIGIDGFRSTDVLFVDINGLSLSMGVDYRLSETNIVLTKALDTIGTPVHFIAMRAFAITEGDYAALKGDPGPAGPAGPTPKFRINENGHLIASFD